MGIKLARKVGGGRGNRKRLRRAEGEHTTPFSRVRASAMKKGMEVKRDKTGRETIWS